MSIFGSTSTTTSQPGGGLFGTANNQQPTGGLFGNPSSSAQNTAQQAPSLFGSTTQTQTQTPSLFGNTGTAGTNTGGGLFGAQNTTNTNQGTGGGGGIFGGQSQPQTTGGSLFGGGGSSNQPAAGGGLFGNTTQSTNTSGGGLFGTNTNQQQPANTSGGGLFGSATQPPTNTGGGGLFGSTTQQSANTGGGGLFGSTTQQPANTGGGGLFGSTTQQPANTGGGGLFGSTTQQPQSINTGGGGLFGSTTQQPTNTGGGLFGSTTQPTNTTSGGLFGSTTQPPQQQQSGGLFGNNSQQPASSGGLFGSKPSNLFGAGLSINTNTLSTNPPATNPPAIGANSNSLFSSTFQQQPAAIGGLFSRPSQQQQQQQQQPQQQQPSIFGNLGQSTSNNSLFGGGNNSTLGGGFGQQGGGLGASTLTTNSLLSTRGPSGPAQQQTDTQTQHVRLLQRIEAVYNAWNPASPQCRFKHVFYNLVNPNQVSLYRQPPNVSDELWAKALRENPDPKCLVPVIATGFDDLRERINGQSTQAEQQKKNLKDLKTRLDALAERHALSNTTRLQRASSHQTQLTQRLHGFVQHLHLLIPAIRSSSIRPEEEQLRGQLEEIEDDVRRGRLKGKLNELWALIGAINAASERGRNGNGTGAGEWALVDEEGLGQITQILTEQQNGLAHLTKILQQALKDLNVIMGSRGAGSGEDMASSYAGDESSLWESKNTLRASTLR